MKAGARMIVLFAVRMAVGIAVFVALGAGCAAAQQEVDPDHFDSPNIEPASPSKSAALPALPIRYDGHFSLPYAVRCSGKKLAPGQYSLSLRSNGRVAHGVLRSPAQTVEVASVVHTQARKGGSNVIVVQSQKNLRTLSAIRIAGLVFVVDSIGFDPPPHGQYHRVHTLPLAVLVSRRPLVDASP